MGYFCSKMNKGEPKIKKQKEIPQLSKKFFHKWRVFFGVLCFLLSIISSISFISFIKNWKADQSQAGQFLDRSLSSTNIFGKIGDWLGNVFVLKSFGISALILSFLLFFLSTVIFRKKIFKPWKTIGHSIFFLCWTPILLGGIFGGSGTLPGVYGYQMADFLGHVIGNVGLWLIILSSIILYFILEFNVRPDAIKERIKTIKSNIKKVDSNEDTSSLPNNDIGDIDSTQNNESKLSNQTQPIQPIPIQEYRGNDQQVIQKVEPILTPSQQRISEKSDQVVSETPTNTIELSTQSTPDTESSEKHSEVQVSITPQSNDKTFDLKIETPVEDPEESSSVPLKTSSDTQTTDSTLPVSTPSAYDDGESKAAALVQKYGEYDPKLDLNQFKMPNTTLLKDYGNTEITIERGELEENKNKIVSLLQTFNVNISEIKAAVGPTIILYEIIPEAGTRVATIKNLQDDIALNLSALGIRIIAPMPGKGTIGIEVPRKNPILVPMKQILESPKFKNSGMELPIAFGRTITNDVFMADLTKMPHLLMAGATGQGKSVGINVILASLLFSKHPSEVKFIMVDPKMVELSLFSKIERHYLAKLPDTQDAIITDPKKVIATLNSLCVEMEDRYALLLAAFCKNITEYNTKFKQRKLNPENGHRFMPYLVLVVDEYADLVMTAGREIEQPIARLAQKARAIGIHLIIATQRPSVNIITGVIKANFPARVAFRVTNNTDSRTILDASGAKDLIGRGDMLFSNGNDLIRLQCAFIDTPEVERLADFIGEQKGYSGAYELPEVESTGSASNSNGVDPNERDPLFAEAARIVVGSQQGSTSMLQRQLKLGYNRAGRIMDQLETFGVVGAFNGAKAREVQFSDLQSLEQFLESIPN